MSFSLAARNGLAFMLAALAALPTAAHAQASPAPYTMGLRYDPLGRPTGTIYPDPDGSGPLRFRAERRTYDDGGRVTRVENGELAGWQSEAIAPANWADFTLFASVDTIYDSRDHKVRETRSSGVVAVEVTQFSYDPLDRLVCTAVRLNPAAFSNLPDACTPGPAGSNGPDRITSNIYDAAGQLIQVRKAVGTSVEQAYATYSFTPNGKEQYLIDANGNRTQFTYDGFDRKSGWYFPSTTRPAAFDPSTPATALATAGGVSGGDHEAYGYDPNDNRTSLKKRDGVTINFQYDGLDRITRKIVPASVSGAAGYSVYYGYDVRDQELYARFGSDNGPGITNTYDGFGRLATTSTNMDGTARTITHTLDADGNLTALTATSGYAMNFAYDQLDRLVRVMDSGGSTMVSITYDAAGRRQGMGLAASGVSYGHDGLGRLTSIAHDLGGTAHDQTLSFGYNSASQINTRGSSNDAYASNAAYNVSRGYSVNGLNQYTVAGPATFQYDGNGNLIWDGATSFKYDAENRLVAASGANTANLSYDPHGRLWQISGGASGTTRLEYDPGASPSAGDDRLLQEWGAAGNLLRVYAHGTGDDEPLVWFEFGGGPPHRYYHADHEGSIIALTDGAGNMVSINAYDEWGIPNSANAGRFGYTGQTWLSDLGLWYYKARVYSPTLGRFLQTDPIGYGDQINLYAYVGNDPVNAKDPSGEEGVVAWVVDSAKMVANDLADLGTAIYRGDFEYAFGGMPPTLGGGTLSTVGNASKAVLSIEARSAAAAGARARQVHSVLDPLAQSRRTTAVLRTSRGTVVAGGGRDLTAAQRATLRSSEKAARSPGAHAEVTALQHAARTGAAPRVLATSRPMCPNCREAVRAAGGTIRTPTTATFPKPRQWWEFWKSP